MISGARRLGSVAVAMLIACSGSTATGLFTSGTRDGGAGEGGVSGTSSGDDASSNASGGSGSSSGGSHGSSSGGASSGGNPHDASSGGPADAGCDGFFGCYGPDTGVFGPGQQCDTSNPLDELRYLTEARDELQADAAVYCGYGNTCSHADCCFGGGLIPVCVAY